MGPCLSSGKDDMDKPVSKKHMAGAKKAQKARTNKSQQAQKIAAAERTGNLSMSGAKLTEIPPQVLQIQKVRLRSRVSVARMSILTQPG